MWGFKSYTDEFYILEIQKENMKVINHFHTYCRDYFRKTYKKLFQEENLEDDFFQESFVKLWKEIRRCSIFVQNNQIYKRNAAGEINLLKCSLRTYLIDITKNDYNQYLRKKEVSADTVSSDTVIPGGMPVGIYLETEGVMVLGTEKITGADGKMTEPARHLVKAGDYIVECNGKKIADKKRLQDTLKKLDAEEVVLKLRRDSGYLDVKIKPVRNKKNQYMLGIWVRDNAQGLGTVTFLNTDSRFGALGHGIHDTDTNTLMEIKDGRVYETSIRSIQKGAGGEPGGIEGIIVYNRYNVLGTIDKNTDCGIFGTLERTDNLFRNTEPVGIMATDEIKKGDAVIRCCVEGKVKEYKIRITKTDKHTKEENKGLEIKVTDPELLEITGGIIQGMSGAPILQNGKIAGAVTHVFVNDPARGYGIFIENMLKHVE